MTTRALTNVYALDDAAMIELCFKSQISAYARLYRTFIRNFYVLIELQILVGERKLSKKTLCMIIMLQVSALMIGIQITKAGPNPSFKIRDHTTGLTTEVFGSASCVGTHFTIDGWINVTGLYGVDIQIGWNPEWINYVGHNKRLPLNSPTTPLKNDVDETANMPGSAAGTMYWVAEASLSPAAPFTGTASCFDMEFVIVKQPAPGEDAAVFNVQITSATLADASGNPIPHDDVSMQVTILPLEHIYSPEPLLKVSPTTYHPVYNHTFNVNIPLMNLLHGDLSPEWDVAGFEFKLTYNSTLLHGLGVTVDPDSWFASFWPGGVFIIKNETNDATGLAWICFIGLPAADGTHTPVEGQGRIAVVHFNATCELPPSFTVDALQLGIIDLTISGFPHPGNPWPPWNGLDCAVDLPSSVEGVPKFLFGDVNFDDAVNILDIVNIASIYGCKEGERNWIPEADLVVPYGKIDILDLVTCTAHYGEHQ